jgi:lactoylglutathione lyase
MKCKYFFLLLTVAAAFSTQAQTSQVPVFNHTTIYVVDLEKSAAFYENVLGIRKIEEPFKDGKHVWFSVGGHGQLHVVKGATALVTHDINIHLCFSVASLEAFMAHLDAVQVKYGDWYGNKHPQTRPDGVHQIYFQDPDGYWLEVNDDKN